MDPVAFRPGSPAVALAVGLGYVLFVANEDTVITHEQRHSLIRSVRQLQRECHAAHAAEQECSRHCDDIDSVLAAIGARAESAEVDVERL